MLEITTETDGNVKLTGRFDASQADKAQLYFRDINSSCNIDLKGLEYISSAGLGVLIDTFKRLTDGGHTLKLVNPNQYIRNVFRYSGLDKVFVIENDAAD